MSKARSAAFPAVSILYGRRAKEALFDEYLAGEHIERIKAALGGEDALTVTDADALEADIPDVLDEASTPSMWGGRRLVILRNAQALLAPAVADRDRMAPLVERAAALAALSQPPGYLVLVARALDVKSGTPQSAWKPAQRLIEAVAVTGGLGACVPPYERDLLASLRRAAQERGASLMPDAARALIALVGTEQMALMEELEKLVIAASDSKRITAEDVETLAAARPERSVFTLAERILDGDVAGALQTLQALRETAATRSSAYILGGARGTFQRYYAAALDVEKGQSPRQAASAAGVPRFFQEPFVRRLERRDAAATGAILARALQCDVEIKTGSVSEEAALETFVVEACSGRPKVRDLVGRWLHEI